MEEIGNIGIPRPNSAVPLFIRDVAEIKIGTATRYGAMTYNDEGEAAGAIVMMLKGANSSEVIKAVKEKMEEIKKTLPEGLEIESFLDRTKMVNQAIKTVETNLMEGALIVVFVLMLFLGNMRAGALVASVIPLAMLFAICMMNLFGVSGNLMSLGALDFGLIIDGAVIIVEAVMHQISQSSRYQAVLRIPQKELNKLVVHASGKMMNSAVFGQIIILIVYLPILSLEGIEGKMFKPMAQTVAFALLGAFILSLTYIPMMSSIILRKHSMKPNFSDRFMGKLETYYTRLLKFSLRIPKILLGAVVLLFMLAIFVLSRMGGEFIPSLEEGDFAVDTRVLPGSNLNTTIKSTQQAAKILMDRFPEVEKVVTKIGSGEVPTDPMPMEASDMMVILKDKKEWTSAKTFPELAEKMSTALADVPGITVGFQYPVQMRFNELMTGARQDVVLKIFGEDLDSLSFYAQKVGKVIEQVGGTQNLYVEPISGLPQVEVSYRQGVLAQYQLTVAEVNRVLNTAFAGESAGLLFEGEKRFDIMVRLSDESRTNIKDIQNLLIPIKNGQQIPLGQLANVELKQSPNQIQRENAQRRIVVGFNIKDRDVQSIVDELKEKVGREIKLPVGYSISYGGSFENLQHAKERLLIAVPIALGLIFVLLFFAFKSVKESLLIYTAIPLSIIGGVFFLALRHMPFSISAGIGFIALFGVVVLNGIVLISEFNSLKKHGVANVLKTVLMGTKNRFRPVLMTASVASLGFIPMALSNGAGAEVQRPLATVVIGGLLVATLLTLLILPILFVQMERWSFHKKSTNKVGLILFIFMGLGISQLRAQDSIVSGNLQFYPSISLSEAKSMAINNNRGLKIDRLQSDYRKALTGSATAEIPKTDFLAEYGQINSPEQEMQLSVSQSIAFPILYKRQRNWNENNWQKSLMEVSLGQFELEKQLSITYYHLQYLLKKRKLLEESEGIYSQIKKKVDLRQRLGEGDLLESAAAQLQLDAIGLQMKEVDQELHLMQLRLKWLLNTETAYLPQLEPSLFPFQELDNTHPELQILQQENQLAKDATAIEKARLLPNLVFGYQVNSFKLHVAQAGVSIPVFSAGQKSKISAAKVGEQIASQQLEQKQQQLAIRKQQLYESWKVNLEILKRFEQSSLKQAALVVETANKKFEEGDINYLELYMLLNQSISIRSNYLEALWKTNKSAIDLQYISTR